MVVVGVKFFPTKKRHLYKLATKQEFECSSHRWNQFQVCLVGLFSIQYMFLHYLYVLNGATLFCVQLLVQIYIQEIGASGIYFLAKTQFTV